MGKECEQDAVRGRPAPSDGENSEDKNTPRRRRRFKWPGAVRKLVRESAGVSGREISELITKVQEMTGYPRRACRLFVNRAGLFEDRSYHRWTVDEQERLLQLLEKHTVPEAAGIIKRSQKSVYALLSRLRIGAKDEHDWFSVSALADALVVSEEKIEGWIRKGWLKPTLIEAGKLTWRVIKPDAFSTFCRRYGHKVVGNRLSKERLEFVHHYVFAPSHAHLFSVRESKKERRAFQKQMEQEHGAGEKTDNRDEQGEDESPG